MPVSPRAQAQWQRAVERAKHTSAPGEVLIDKTLTVTGPRQFKKKWALTRLIQWAIKWSTLTLIRPNPWKLTRPQKIVSLPLLYEAAYGGQCRINQKDNTHLAAGNRKQEAKLKTAIEEQRAEFEQEMRQRQEAASALAIEEGQRHQRELRTMDDNYHSTLESKDHGEKDAEEVNQLIEHETDIEITSLKVCSASA